MVLKARWFWRLLSLPQAPPASAIPLLGPQLAGQWLGQWLGPQLGAMPTASPSTAQATGWPRLAGAWGSPEHGLALRGASASGEPAGCRRAHLFSTWARTEVVCGGSLFHGGAQELDLLAHRLHLADVPGSDGRRRDRRRQAQCHQRHGSEDLRATVRVRTVPRLARVRRSTVMTPRGKPPCAPRYLR